MARTVLLVDDNQLIRRMLRAWIEEHKEWQICGEAENGRIAVEQVKQLNPELVILDLQMPVMNGLEAARKIGQIAPNAKMIMFTVHYSQQLVWEAKRVGVQYVVSKCDMLGGHLLTAMRQASA